jgi:lipoprotein-anchoring transpeptidase ErfK/SrfK
MKHNKWKISASFVMLFAIFALFAATLPAAAAGEPQTGPSVEPYSGEPLCLPAAYLNDPQDCLPYGPSQYITDLAKQGILYPFLPLNASKPDPSLGVLDYGIAKVNVYPPERAPIYGSLDAAAGGGDPVNYLQAGNLLYVAFSTRTDIDGNAYVYTANGGWMRASPASYMSFQGLLFDEAPNTSFGWIVESTKPQSAPSYNAPEINITLSRETSVQIFDKVQADGTEYYMIGVNRWVSRRFIRELVVNTTPPEGVSGGRWIEINLYEQTLSVYDNNQLIFATLIASGVEPYYTRPGLFQIYEKKPTETMSGAFASDLSDYYYLEDVPWTMYFDEARAIHGAYWRAWLGYEQSHGCVNMSIADSRWVFDWAQVGDWVYVWDPSGETPTDPSLYTQGGA